MKIKLFFATILFFIGIGSAQAGPFQWHGSITFTDGLSYTTVNISGPTHSACEQQRSFTKMIYAPTHWVFSETPCVPILFDPDWFKYLEFREIPKFPWPGPVCLSCPYLSEELINVIYPAHVEEVLKLKEEFRIDEYNMELQELNNRFNVGEFDQKLHEIGNQMHK